MFRNVIIGIDGRSGGRDAIALARQLADPDATFTLANVYLSAVPLVPSLLAWDEIEQQKASTLLEAERSRANIPAEAAPVCAASACEGLHRLAEERHADLLVLGSSSRSLIGRVLLGDDARASLNGAPCAVALAPRGYAEGPVPIARVGVGYDGSPESAVAVEAARAVAQAHRAEVQARFVVDTPGLPPATPGAWTDVVPQMLEQAEAEVQSLDGVRGTAVLGLPNQELVAMAHDVDLLVVGSRGYGPVRRMVIGSTAGYLQRHAPCPLLVVRRRPAPDSDAGAAQATAGDVS